MLVTTCQAPQREEIADTPGISGLDVSFMWSEGDPPGNPLQQVVTDDFPLPVEPMPRRTTRSTAGQHPNRFHLPRSVLEPPEVALQVNRVRAVNYLWSGPSNCFSAPNTLFRPWERKIDPLSRGRLGKT